MISKICIPLTARLAHIIIVLSGHVALRDYTNFVVLSPPWSEGMKPTVVWLKAHSEYGEENYTRAHPRDLLARGESPRIIHEVTRPGVWPLQRYPYKRLQ